jgi:tRNA-dihydrouridine synthase
MYKGDADWDLIAKVKNNQRLFIPIIGNGDVTTPERAAECFDKYGVDAVMIGRGSIGRPWIFSEFKHYFKTGENIPILTFDEQKSVLKEHIIASIYWLDIAEETPLETVSDKRLKGVIHGRRHLAASPVFKGIPNFKETRIAMLRAETMNELFGIIDSIELNNNIEYQDS